MQDYLIGRTTEEIKGFVLGVVKDAMVGLEGNYDLSSIEQIYSDVEDGTKLNENQRAVLEFILHHALKEEVDKLDLLPDSPSLIHTVDQWSIYSDAWGIYCVHGAPL
jgi:hypothetical protein